MIINKLITSLNLCIVAIGIGICFQLSSWLPYFLPMPWYLPNILEISNYISFIQAVISAYAIFLGIKEKNRTAIILSSLILFSHLERFLSQLVALALINIGVI